MNMDDISSVNSESALRNMDNSIIQDLLQNPDPSKEDFKNL